MAILYYFHDPMCSWCWGYRPVSDQLFSKLPREIERQNIVGGLAPDSDSPMPVDQQNMIQSHWHKISKMLGTEFNHDFWTQCMPRRSTYPACRAVLAAARQKHEKEMTDAIQRAYYLQAKNPSDESTLIELAGELGIDQEQFTDDLRSDVINKELLRQVEFSRQSPINGYPSLVLQINDEAIPIQLDYKDCNVTLNHINLVLGSR